MFRNALIAVSCFTMIASSAVVAQPRHHGPQHERSHVQKKVIHAPARGHVRNQEMRRHQEVRRHHWARGQRVDNWRSRGHVSDYRRHGLRAPARGQAWVRVDNNYLLLSMATGVVAAIAAAR
jgi:Ni/Co efflux regulator RcnB